MTPTGKSQPQELLESIIPHDENEKYPSEPEPLNDAPKFPTIQEQNAYWQEKEKAAEPTPPRKWSLARRKAYNRKKITGWSPVPPPAAEATVPVLRHCPNCGESLERWRCQ